MVNWIPSRQDIIWIDCSPQMGQEMRNLHPFVVLSPKVFNDKTSLVIGLPMTTAEYNKDNPFAITIGITNKKGIAKQSYVLCHQPKSFDWRARGASQHPLRKISNYQLQEVSTILNQIIML
jgi:mRNA interferase MazF